jgi:hypothetical protein
MRFKKVAVRFLVPPDRFCQASNKKRLDLRDRGSRDLRGWDSADGNLIMKTAVNLFFPNQMVQVAQALLNLKPSFETVFKHNPLPIHHPFNLF